VKRRDPKKLSFFCCSKCAREKAVKIVAIALISEVVADGVKWLIERHQSKKG
jgi:hypothetical protein